MDDKKLERILYVEDEQDIAAITQIALEEIGGFTVKYCSSGKAALNESKAFNPDLFIIDVIMPEMDGITLFKELKKIPEFIDTPIIFMTAKTQAAEIREYLALGLLDVITKPFDPMKLADILRQKWEKRNG